MPFIGDWDGDGLETPGLPRQSDGYVYLRNSNTQGIADIRFFFGNPGDVPLVGDFDGDGFDTVSASTARPNNVSTLSTSWVTNDGGLGAADYSFVFGNPGDQPVVGDWDGDGVDEVGLHRASTGFFYYRNTLTTGIADAEFYFGNPGDRFVAGDWGVIDGRDTPGGVPSVHHGLLLPPHPDPGQRRLPIHLARRRIRLDPGGPAAYTN